MMEAKFGVCGKNCSTTFYISVVAA
jgi:hypothetical protein